MSFVIKPAVRNRVPLWIGLAGPSGCGKTKSALRLATGIVSVTGGRIAVVDTEADRALMYAPLSGSKASPPNSFDFDHVTFGAPFSSDRYLEAAEFCISKGATAIVFDSFSHEHESIGGLLEQFEDELERLSKGDQSKAERVKFLAWKKPKMARRRMINGLLQSHVSIIGCFRTQSKLQITKGEDPVKLGYMPITGSEFIYEFPTRLLLLPQSDGTPQPPEGIGEKEWVRVPGNFRETIKPGVQLSETVGAEMARWSMGGVTPGTFLETNVPMKEMQPGEAPATTEQVEEITRELGRLRWTTKQIKEFCAKYDCAWPDKFKTHAKAASAVQELLLREPA